MATHPDEGFALRSDCGEAELLLAPAAGGSVAAYRRIGKISSVFCTADTRRSDN